MGRQTPRGQLPVLQRPDEAGGRRRIETSDMWTGRSSVADRRSSVALSQVGDQRWNRVSLRDVPGRDWPRQCRRATNHRYCDHDTPTPDHRSQDPEGPTVVKTRQAGPASASPREQPDAPRPDKFEPPAPPGSPYLIRRRNIRRALPLQPAAFASRAAAWACACACAERLRVLRILLRPAPPISPVARPPASTPRVPKPDGGRAGAG